MDFGSETTYWFDHFFLHEHGSINELNCLQYFQKHHEYDKNCIKKDISELTQNDK